MYTFVVEENNTLSVTKKERIMEKSKLVDKLCFLVPPFYKDMDMQEFSVILEYVLPISKKYRTELLTLVDNDKKIKEAEEYLQFNLPINTVLTNEVGKVELQLTFVSAELDEETGEQVQYVRKISPSFIDIIPISNWSQFIPDEALNALDQRILMTNAQIKELKDIAEVIDNTKADNLVFDNSVLQLSANGELIGDAVTLEKLAEHIIENVIENEDDGIVRVVEF